MGWSVVLEEEHGLIVRSMPKDFILSDQKVLKYHNSRLLKYLNPYGDTTFNFLMLEDLITDFIELKALLPEDKEQIELVIEFIKECAKDIDGYVKFYGD